MSEEFTLKSLGGSYIDYTESVCYTDLDGNELASAGDRVALVVGGEPGMYIKFRTVLTRPILASDGSLIFDEGISTMQLVRDN